MSTPNEVIDRYIAAMRSGDYETGFGFFAEDVAFRIPGRSEWAGEHSGREAAVAYIRNAPEMAHQGEVEVELVDRLTSDERVALPCESGSSGRRRHRGSGGRTCTGSAGTRSPRCGSSRATSTRSTRCSAS